MHTGYIFSYMPTDCNVPSIQHSVPTGDYHPIAQQPHIAQFNQLTIQPPQAKPFLSPISPSKTAISPRTRKTSIGKPDNICQMLSTMTPPARRLSTAGLEFGMNKYDEKRIDMPMRKISLAPNMKM